MKLKKKTIKKPRVEMIPLIDSVFLILVFFIYAFISMTLHKGLPVNLPHATASSIDQADYCSITVSKDDTLFLNKQPTDIPALKVALNEMYASDKELRVYINGDKDAHHGAVVQVLDCVRAVGIEKVSIETQGEALAHE
jgi:biopolymer transport protein ExbD